MGRNKRFQSLPAQAGSPWKGSELQSKGDRKACLRRQGRPYGTCYIMPPMPDMSGEGDDFLSSLTSVTRHSVVRTILATEAAFWRA